MAEEKKPLSRKSKKALVSAVVTVLVIAAVILVNAISVTLTEKYAVFTADMTSMKAFELSEQSKEIAENVGKNVTITFLSEKIDYENRDPYCKQTSVIANELAKNSKGMIHVEYVDIVKNPTFAKDYSSEDNLTANDIVVSSGEKKKLLKVSELFTFEAYSGDYQYISSSQSEQVIDNAIVTVTSDVITKVGVVSDNSSQEYSDFVSILEANNYEVSEISLEEDEISNEIQMIMIYEPEQDFSQEALLKLENFLVNDEQYGKNLLYVPEKMPVSHPNIDTFMSVFGMKIEEGIAFEYDSGSRYYESDYYEYIICDFASNLYRSNFSEDKYTPVMTGISRPITITSAEATPLLVLSDESGILPYMADEDWSMKDSITKNVCVMAQTTLGSEEAESALVVIGSADMISQNYFNNSLGNRTYIMTMLAEINGRDSKMIAVADKVITNFDINLDAQARFWIGFLMYAVIPLLILGCGFTVFLIRRNQ